MQLASSDVAAGMKNRPLNESVQRASGSWYGEPFCWETLPDRGQDRARSPEYQNSRGAHSTDDGSANGKWIYQAFRPFTVMATMAAR